MEVNSKDSVNSSTIPPLPLPLPHPIPSYSSLSFLHYLVLSNSCDLDLARIGRCDVLEHKSISFSPSPFLCCPGVRRVRWAVLITVRVNRMARACVTTTTVATRVTSPSVRETVTMAHARNCPWRETSDATANRDTGVSIE